MKDDLAIALIQTELYWEDVTANLSALEEKIAQFEKGVDVIVLPEMFNSGFTMNTGIAEPLNLTTTKWMKQIAKQNDALVMGSFAVREGKDYYNRLLSVFPDGSVSGYDKRHLFRMGQEHDVYTAGKSRKLISWRGWQILGLVCYDLRFPVWSRNIPTEPYDLLIYVANWPARRDTAWKTLLPARAIENQSYVVGVNRIGVDGNDIVYNGDSVALDYLGEPLCTLESHDLSQIVHLSKTNLETYKKQFPAYLDADPYQLTIQ